MAKLRAKGSGVADGLDALGVHLGAQGVVSLTAMRSRPGSAPLSSANGRSRGGAGYGLPNAGSDVASSSAAESRTDLVSACSLTMPDIRSP